MSVGKRQMDIEAVISGLTSQYDYPKEILLRLNVLLTELVKLGRGYERECQVLVSIAEALHRFDKWGVNDGQ